MGLFLKDTIIIIYLNENIEILFVCIVCMYSVRIISFLIYLNSIMLLNCY